MSWTEAIKAATDGKGGSITLVALVLYVGVTDAMAPTAANVTDLKARVEAQDGRITVLEGDLKEVREIQAGRFDFAEEVASIVNELCGNDEKCSERHSRVKVPK